MKLRFVLLLAVSTMAACAGKPGKTESSPPTVQKPDSVVEPANDNPFPLHPGAYWIYNGTVKWTRGSGPDGIAEKTLSWKMEVVRSMNVGRYEVAVMKGHPSDLAWYEEGKQPGEYVIVRDGGKYYSLPGSDIPDIDALGSRLNFDSVFLEIPVPDGCIARDPEIKRDDVMYCWAAVPPHPKPTRLDGVRGISPEKEFNALEFAMRTNPDHQFFTFVPAVGITSYVYGHHGTVSEVDMKLVEYHPGEATPDRKR